MAVNAELYIVTETGTIAMNKININVTMNVSSMYEAFSRKIKYQIVILLSCQLWNFDRIKIYQNHMYSTHSNPNISQRNNKMLENKASSDL